MLPNNLATLSDLPENTEDKNRYANVIPNPTTRVPLEIGVKEGASGYVNANFVKVKLVPFDLTHNWFITVFV